MFDDLDLELDYVGEESSENKLAFKKSGDRYLLRNNSLADLVLEISFEEYCLLETETNSLEKYKKFLTKRGLTKYLDREVEIVAGTRLDRFIATIFVYENTLIELPFGVYDFCYASNVGTFLSKKEITKIDQKYFVPTHDLKSIVRDWISTEPEGRKNKRGLLLYGPPGNSKTISINALEDLVKTEEFYIIYNTLSVNELNSLRPYFKDKKVLLVQEELTESLNREGVGVFLRFLDGENSWDNIMVIATTNYPEDFPANLVDRPGRFDTFIEFTPPTNDQIKELGIKFGREDYADLFNKNLSFDYVSYMMSLSNKLKTSLLDTIKNEEEKRKKLSSTFKGKIGIR